MKYMEKDFRPIYSVCEIDKIFAIPVIRNEKHTCEILNPTTKRGIHVEGKGRHYIPVER